MPRSSPPNVHPVPAFAPGVRDAVYRHVYRDPANELGGLLVGDRRPLGDMVVGAIPADGARGDVTSLTFTQASWASMLAVLDHRYPGAEVLGWYHSHPGHGVFLSRQDRFIHQHFFPAPWHVAVVVDPQRHHEGLFMWRPQGLVSVAEAPIDPAWAAARSSATSPSQAAPAAASPPSTSRPSTPRPSTPDPPTGRPLTPRPPIPQPSPAPRSPAPGSGDSAFEPAEPVAGVDERDEEWARRREASLHRRAARAAEHRKARRLQAWAWLTLSVGIAAWVLKLWG